MRFKHATTVKIVCLSLLAILTIGSCTEKDLYIENPEVPETPPSKDDFFDFSTTQKFTVDINYCLSNYSILFELYDKDPLIARDGGFEKIDEEPIYRAITDKNGRFNDKITLPAYVKTVYLYTNYLGVSQSVALEIENKAISFNQESYWDSVTSRGGVVTRASTESGKSYPDGYKVLGDWDNKGNADYIAQAGKRALDPDFMTRLTNTFVKKNVRYDPVFVGNGKSMDIHINAPTEVYQVFISSGAAYWNSYGYYTYPTNNPPKSPDQIKNKIISFPFIKAPDDNKNCSITSGDQVQLKYWNEDTEQFEDQFPAGVSIGFLNLPNAFSSSGNITIKKQKRIEEQDTPYSFDCIYYTNQDYNNKLDGIGGKETQRMVAAYDGEHMVALCFEDHLEYSIDGPSWAWSYNDAIFYLYIEEKSAIDPSIPGLPGDNKGPGEEDNYINYYGTLAFEDLWPSQGDYDMNDMVIRYNSKVYRNASNKVTKIVDEITPVHNGATLTNGFGYQFPSLSKADVKSISILSESGIASSFMKGMTMEPNQDKPTVVLFDDMKEAVAQNATFTVTTLLQGNVNSENVLPPYNPFIVIRSNLGRGHELHLVNNEPTTLVNQDLLGTSDDLSYPEYGIYYVSSLNFPFAINLAHDESFMGSNEGVRIDKTYPNFSRWAESHGEENQDWYLQPTE